MNFAINKIAFRIENMEHKVGDDIYIPTALYLSHGVDDFHGGLCKITSVEYGMSAGKYVPFVTVEERPARQYNYIFLLEQQEELKERFGDQRGYPDPDDRPEFNRWD